jgi:hypothetical protein
MGTQKVIKGEGKRRLHFSRDKKMCAIDPIRSYYHAGFYGIGTVTRLLEPPSRNLPREGHFQFGWRWRFGALKDT